MRHTPPFAKTPVLYQTSYAIGKIKVEFNGLPKW